MREMPYQRHSVIQDAMMSNVSISMACSSNDDNCYGLIQKVSYVISANPRKASFEPTTLRSNFLIMTLSYLAPTACGDSRYSKPMITQ